ncbi:hypothetical protein ABIC09_005380 [Bradyrhizobium sp. S3.12.5]
MTSPVHEVTPNVDAGTVLSGAQFIDAMTLSV